MSGGIPVGIYVTQLPAEAFVLDSGNSGAHYEACTFSGFDGGTPGAMGQQSTITKGHLTRSDSYYMNCTPGSLSGGPVSTSATYDANTGNPLGMLDADAMAGISGHTDAADCTINGTAYSACAQYDALYDAMPVLVFNALGQKTQLSYTTDGVNPNNPDANNGWGQWLTAETDPNIQVSAYSYDALDRLTGSTSMGSYTYGDPAHLHAATATSNGYTASYDAPGAMTCRAPTSTTTCVGTQTGAQMTYDAELRLNHWQSAPGSNPGTGADYLYDGEGHRAEQVVSGSAGTTKTYYLFGGSEELTVGGSTTLIKYYPSAGGALPGVMSVNGTISYVATDGLGSLNEALSNSGNVTAQQLYSPYGTVRYSSGTLPTAKGFTGQYGDAATGLDYYNARYYDPTLGQFTSADSVQESGRYAYADDNPETHNDPTGHIVGCLADAFQAAFGGGSWLGAIGTCAGEMAQGARAGAQAKAATNLVSMALTQYGSGNLKYLTPEGADAVEGVAGRSAMASASLASIKNPGSALGFGEDTPDRIGQGIKGVIRNSDAPGDYNWDNVRAKGVGGGDSPIGELDGAIEDSGRALSGWRVAGKVLGIAGVLLTGTVAGINDYNTHHDWKRAIAVGALHAGLSWGGALLFGAIGGAIGSFAGPGGTVIGSFLGASFGGWAGDQAAGWLVNFNDSGGFQGVETAAGNALTDVGNTFSNIFGF